MSHKLRLHADFVPRLSAWLAKQEGASYVTLTMGLNKPPADTSLETLRCEAMLPNGHVRTHRIAERKRK